jgi:phosphoribosyl-AMP cyclohydrolase
LLEYFNVKVGKEDIFKHTVGNDNLQEICKNNGINVTNFVRSKNLTVKSAMLPHRNIHTFTWTSPDRKTHNQNNHILSDGRKHSSTLDVRSFRGADCDTDHYLMVENLGKNWQCVNKQGTCFIGTDSVSRN